MEAGLFPPTPGFINNWDLHTSSKAGDILRVKYLIEGLDQDVNQHDEHNSSPLFYACLCGHVELVRYLLDCGSKLIPGLYETERCYYGALTPDIQRILTDHKANPNKFDLLAQNMKGLRSLQLHVDFVLHISDDRSAQQQSESTRQSIHLHKFILSARSNWFRDKFLNDWKDKSEVTLSLDEYSEFRSPQALFCFIDFLYTSQVDIDESYADHLASLFEIMGRVQMARKVKKEEKEDREVRRVVVKSATARQALAKELGAVFVHNTKIQANDDEHQINIDMLQDKFHDVCLQLKQTSDDGSVTYHSFFAHKALLCQHSAFFNALITGKWMESLQLESQVSAVPILPVDLNTSPKLLRQALLYLYTNTLSSNFTVDETISLLQLSDQLMIMELKRLCSVRLRKETNLENVFAFLSLADSYQIRMLKQHALDFIEQNIAMLHKLPEFTQYMNEAPEDIRKELQLYLEDKLS